VRIEPGQKLLHYRLIDKLGEGGMGVVWKAVDTRLDRVVAVKILPEAMAGDADALRRFEREARAVAALSHPNVLALYDVGEIDGPAFLVTEMLEGETLRDRLCDHPGSSAPGPRSRSPTPRRWPASQRRRWRFAACFAAPIVGTGTAPWRPAGAPWSWARTTCWPTRGPA